MSGAPSGWRSLMAGQMYNLELPPCIEPGLCKHYQACARWLLACDDFRAFASAGARGEVRDEGERVPSRRVYRRMYGDVD